ncbi:MAG: glycosyltransferase family 4 protein, partial [Actinomycetota bacterium]|nr:glycosyltransferase family 4 protein [Actinomycetota bacterium]
MAEPALDGLRVDLVLASSTGGVGRHVASLAAGLHRLGARVRVLGPAAAEELFGFAAAGAAFDRVEIPSRPAMRDLTALIRLRRLLGTAEVVHAHGLRAGLLSSLALRTAGSGRPAFVVSWHNAVLRPAAPRRLAALGERYVARRPDLTLVASEDLGGRVRSLGGSDVRLAPVAAPELPPARRSAAEMRSELGVGAGPLLLAVGRLHEQKGYDVLLDAACTWAARRPPPMVVIAGDGPLHGQLAATIARTGAPVRLLGRRTDIADLLAAADVVVLPSRWEARSLSAQEALSAGRPLVATAVGGLPELLRGGAAVLVPGGDAAALAAAVTRLLDEPAERAALAARGRQRAAAWPTEADT